MKPYIGDSGVLVPTMHVGCSGIVVENDEVIVYVLVPTIHVGCSINVASDWENDMRFSTHDTRGL